jgi:hypothetical protein
MKIFIDSCFPAPFAIRNPIKILDPMYVYVQITIIMF